MKILFLLLVLALSIPANSQTYYNPQNAIKLTVEIKEPYKPINWAEIGSNLNNAFNTEIQRREKLKRYYEDIFYQTTNSLNSNTLLTNDNDINSKLILLQSASIESLNVLNRLLKSGNLKPDNYESDLKKTYYDYLGANQIFVNLSVYKRNILSSLKNEAEIIEFNKIFNNLVGKVVGFKNYNGIKFNLLGLQDDYDFNIFYNSLTSTTDKQFKEYIDSKK